MVQPSSICGYEIIAELGRGTTGIVYKARHRVVRPERFVALKVPSLEPPSEAPRRLARFVCEWHVLIMLTHKPDPFFPRLYDVGRSQDGSQHYFARAFVEGDTLEQMVVDGTIGLRDGIGVLSEIARAVHRLHCCGIVHRNLRPSNVVIRRDDGKPQLIGFGLAHLLAGSAKLPPGASGYPVETDLQALREMLEWLCAANYCSLPARIMQPGSVATAEALRKLSAAFSKDSGDSRQT